MPPRFYDDLLRCGQGTPSIALENRISAISYHACDPSSSYIGPPSILDALSSIQFIRAPSLLKLEDLLLAQTLEADQLQAASQCDPVPMDSVGSSSNVQTVEERLADIQHSLDALELKADAQDNSIKHNAVEGLSQWKTFANELSTLKKDLKDSKGELNYYKDVVFTEFKDAANTTGNFGKRITALESAVKKILEKFN